MVSKRHNVVVIDDWDGICAGSPALAELAAEVDLTMYDDRPDRRTLLERLSEADIVVPFRERTRFDAELLQALPRLRLIAQTGGGVAHIDLAAAASLGIAVAVTPGASAISVAELCLGLMLAVYHRIGEGDRALRLGQWPALLGRDLHGRTLGLAGFGHTGRALAPRAAAMGMRVLAWSRSLSPDRAPAGVEAVSSLRELFARSDCVSLHLRLTNETRGLITYTLLSQLPPGAVLINTARGALVVEQDLIQALEDGVVSGAGLDVYAVEPLPPDSPLRNLPNVVLTPHVGWTTGESQERYLAGVVRNIRAFMAGDRSHLVNS